MKRFVTMAVLGSLFLASTSFAQSTSTVSTTTTGAAAPPAANSTNTVVSTTTPATPAVTPQVAVPAPADRTTTTSGVLATQSSDARVEDEPLTETTSPINRPLLVTGVVLLGGTYVASAVDSLASGRPEDRANLAVPIVGPWMDFANRNCAATPCANGGSGTETFNRALLIADGIGQGLGALSIVTSFFLPEKSTRHWLLIGDDHVTAGPTMVGSGYGLGAVGRF